MLQYTTSLRDCLAVVAVMLMAWKVPAEEVKSPSQGEIEKLQQADLMVLSQTLKTYRVDQMPASKALQEIWILATGQPPQLMGLEWRSENKTAVEPQISLNLHDVPATEIIRYISELAASRWEIRGWSGDALTLTLHHLTQEDDSSLMVFASIAKVDATGASLLGLKPDMSSAAVVAALRNFGVPFNDDKHPAAAYNAKGGQIIAIVPHGEKDYLPALAKLANRGQIKPAGQP